MMPFPTHSTFSSLVLCCGLTVGVFADDSERPDTNRFTVVQLTPPDTLNEPMMFEVATDGRTFIIERRGGIKLFDPLTQNVKPVGMLGVNTEVEVGNGEQGLVGMSLDPKFDENGWMYLYYFHPVEAKAILSRWEIREDVLVANSERIMLEWPAQREICCHTGGGMAWDSDGNLYLTVGNNRGNNIPAHTDERPGRENWDDQSGSANTNSLEGKILRIHPEEDGSYTIPDGNLFPVGTPKARPEIYTMGHRNAWRVTVDSKTGFMYWGEVGPDARQDSEMGPKGWDEFNQARDPGFFGWPYFVGESSFPLYDYETKTPGPLKDKGRPLNESPNNTGLVELPPMAPSFVYYPYEFYDKFPELGTGGRSATGGPIYRRADFSDPIRPWPSYFEGKWLASELSRRMIFAVEMDEGQNYKGMERLFADYRPVEPIDMKFGPSGDLYVLEYGGRWFRSSPDAKLSRIEYEAGNRAPIVVASADKVGGIPPFKVSFSSIGTEDYDGDPLSYRWDVVDLAGNTRTFDSPNPTVELDLMGAYTATLNVSDPSGATVSETVKVVSGNEPPTVAVHLHGNETFYFPGEAFDYSVDVEDNEDGSLKDGDIDAEHVVLTIDYAAADFDLSIFEGLNADSDPAAAAFPVAAALMVKGKCVSCHLPTTKLVGPSFLEVASKYQNDPEAAEFLVQKIVSGGVGVWGAVPMPPNFSVSETEAAAILKYVFSFAGSSGEKLPLAGSYTPTVPQGGEGGSFIVRAVYRDQGEEIAPPLASQEIKVLRSPVLAIASADVSEKVETGRRGASVVHSAFLGFRDIDMTGVNRLEIGAFAMSFANHKGGDIEIRVGSPTGPVIGKTTVSLAEPTPRGQRGRRGGGNAARSVDDTPPASETERPRRARGRRFGPPPASVAIESVSGREDLFLVFQNPGAAEDEALMSVSSITLSRSAATN
ncbi:PQQ-dependent sugar dehydrogenase [Verrucomicrobia bacterium]|nr:PQQ-dependent sugar dehydrogenase [Verrucomicrobiota bacterium]